VDQVTESAHVPVLASKQPVSLTPMPEPALASPRCLAYGHAA
jgi:hypothetical protein